MSLLDDSLLGNATALGALLAIVLYLSQSVRSLIQNRNGNTDRADRAGLRATLLEHMRQEQQRQEHTLRLLGEQTAGLHELLLRHEAVDRNLQLLAQNQANLIRVLDRIENLLATWPVTPRV